MSEFAAASCDGAYWSCQSSSGFPYFKDFDECQSDDHQALLLHERNRAFEPQEYGIATLWKRRGFWIELLVCQCQSVPNLLYTKPFNMRDAWLLAVGPGRGVAFSFTGESCFSKCDFLGTAIQRNRVQFLVIG
jgi:hypothetical protein